MSTTVMVKEHVAVFADKSVAVHEMLVTPTAKDAVTSGSRLHLTVADPLLSVAKGSDHDTMPVAKPAVVLAV